jgi:hypothetical protein
MRPAAAFILAKAFELLLSVVGLGLCMQALVYFLRVQRRVNSVIKAYAFVLLVDSLTALVYIAIAAHDLAIEGLLRGQASWWCDTRAFLNVTLLVSHAWVLAMVSFALRGAVKGYMLSVEQQLSRCLWGSALGFLVAMGFASGGSQGPVGGVMCLYPNGWSAAVLCAVLLGSVLAIATNYVVASSRLQGSSVRPLAVEEGQGAQLQAQLGSPRDQGLSGWGGGAGDRDRGYVARANAIVGNNTVFMASDFACSYGAWGLRLRSCKTLRMYTRMTARPSNTTPRPAALRCAGALVVALGLSIGQSVGINGPPPAALMLLASVCMRLPPVLDGAFLAQMLWRIHRRFCAIGPNVAIGTRVATAVVRLGACCLGST